MQQRLHVKYVTDTELLSWWWRRQNCRNRHCSMYGLGIHDTKTPTQVWTNHFDQGCNSWQASKPYWTKRSSPKNLAANWVHACLDTKQVWRSDDTGQKRSNLAYAIKPHSKQFFLWFQLIAVRKQLLFWEFIWSIWFRGIRTFVILLDIPPPPFLPFPPTHHSHCHSTSSLLFSSSSPPFPPLPLPSLPVPCLLSLTPPEAKQRPVIAPRNTWYDRPDPPPWVGGGRRPRGVGINCLVALEREAWRNEFNCFKLPVTGRTESFSSPFVSALPKALT